MLSGLPLAEPCLLVSAHSHYCLTHQIGFFSTAGNMARGHSRLCILSRSRIKLHPSDSLRNLPDLHFDVPMVQAAHWPDYHSPIVEITSTA